MAIFPFKNIKDTEEKLTTAAIAAARAMVLYGKAHIADSEAHTWSPEPKFEVFSSKLNVECVYDHEKPRGGTELTYK